MDSKMQSFCADVWEYYAHNARDLPWRQPDGYGFLDPYHVLVSEIMLQQTQANRVESRYAMFLQEFPNVQTLANAPLGDVVRAWQGLGYNRRAKYLWQTARIISAEHNAKVPTMLDQLVQLPGIGKNTAAAICCYAFNICEPFIETNIRTVYIHHFFGDANEVSDAELWPIIQHTWDKEHPRDWGWALMDYGNFLKSKVGNVSRRSKHYSVQSKFEGSRRQLRGQIIAELTKKPLTRANLAKLLTDERLDDVLDSLRKEGFIISNGDTYQLV